MKKIIVFVCLLLLVSFVYAFELNRTEFLKGETLEVTGICPPVQDVLVKATSEGKQVFTEKVFCQQGQFFFSHKISFFDPSGDWDLDVAGEMLELTVSPTRESKFLVIRFLSPAIHLTRAQDINVVVQITDAGRPLTDANVLTWDAGGVKKQLIHKGKGNYIYEASLPFGMPLGVWNLMVVAQSGPNGGEEIHRAMVDQAIIDFEVIEPEVSTYSLDAVVPVKVKVTYFNGSPLQGAALSALVAGESQALKQLDAETFTFDFVPQEKHEGALKFIIRATDSAGNTADKTLDLVIVKGLSWYAKTLFWPAVVLLVVVIGAYFYLRSQKRQLSKRTQLQQKKREIAASLKRVQEKYYSGKLDKKIFRQEYARLSKEADEVKAELTSLKKKKLKKK